MDGIPHFFEALPLALQHVVAMIVGCVTPAIIVAGAAGLPQPDRVLLIQASLIAAAIGTCLQLYPIGRRTGLPVSYTHLTLPTSCVQCISRWSPYH